MELSFTSCVNRVYSQPLCLQAESLITAQSLLPRLLKHPSTILQELPVPMMPPGSAPSIRPGGHDKEDLVELTMIQNAEMHQVNINQITLSALSSIGAHRPAVVCQAPRDVVIIQENDADPEMYHHYYQLAQYLYPAWLLPRATLVHQDHQTHPAGVSESTSRLRQVIFHLSSYLT
ncbi:uncharacterized protein C21orf58-like [Cyclopterus lumpus]|uniref:uncharacterized protein C21orf58-like n=1 Tax=Cyclopterus lumpus TaxID=8103 RepID=UPI001486C819|nr:uncharacterized protein C21orf58-like [Cyclopterus lumpus]